MVQLDVGRAGDEAVMLKAKQWVSNFNALAMLVFFLVAYSSWNSYSVIEHASDKYFATVQGVADDLKKLEPFLSESAKADIARKLAPTANDMPTKLEQAKRATDKAHNIAVAATMVALILCATWLLARINPLVSALIAFSVLIIMTVISVTSLLFQSSSVTPVMSAQVIAQIGLTIAAGFSIRRGIDWQRVRRTM